MESLWKHCTVGQKEAIVGELLGNEEELSTDFYGKFVLRNVNVSHFKRKQNVWQSQQQSAGKRRELFQDIIAGDSGTQAEVCVKSACSNAYFQFTQGHPPSKKQKK